MKPSEKIIEKTKKQLENMPVEAQGDIQVTFAVQIQSILDYIDEEWESRQPCAHPEYEDRYGAKLCKRCNILFT